MANEMLAVKIDLPKSVSDVLSFLKKNESISQLILFGSRAHGDFQHKSDFDLAVVIENKDHYEFLRIKDKVENEFNSLFYISLVDYNQSPEKLKDIINKTGILIYESKKN